MKNTFIPKRRPFGFLTKSKFQVRYGLFFTGIAVLSLMALNVINIFLVVAFVSKGPKDATKDEIWRWFIQLVTEHKFVLLGGFGLIVALFSLMAIIYSRNVAGPIVALTRHITALKDGNYTIKTKLRVTDDLKELAAGLNELSDSLATRHGIGNVEDANKKDPDQRQPKAG